MAWPISSDFKYSSSSKTFDGYYFIHKVIARITFLQILYPCLYYLEGPSWCFTDHFLVINLSDYSPFCLPQKYYFLDLFKIFLFCNKWQLSLIILVTFGHLGLNFVERITLLLLLSLLTIFLLGHFEWFYYFFGKYHELFLDPDIYEKENLNILLIRMNIHYLYCNYVVKVELHPSGCLDASDRRWLVTRIGI